MLEPQLSRKVPIVVDLFQAHHWLDTTGTIKRSFPCSLPLLCMDCKPYVGQSLQWNLTMQNNYVPPPKGRETYCFWCGLHRRQRDSFLCAWYLLNRLADFNQICMDIIFWHDEERIRFWWLDLIFKVTVGLKLPNLSQKVFAWLVSWTIGWTVTKFACLYYLGRINSRLDFGDLDLIFKITVRFKTQIIVLQLTLDRNTLFK